MSRKIDVVDYNPEWKKLFKIESKKIKAILGKNCLEIHHIGSTSVKGLKAKPIIDIMPVVKDISLVDAHNKEFEALGYECKGEYGIPGRRFFVKGGDNRTHHIHIFEKSSQTEIERHLAVRDYLNSHQDTASEYGELKAELAEKFTYDNENYCKGKDAFVKKLEQDALEWKKRQDNIGLCMSMGMCLGVGIGSALGTMFSNISIGMCLGISVGMCLGLAIGYAKNPDK